MTTVRVSVGLRPQSSNVTFLPVFPPRRVPSVPYSELRTESVRYLIVTIVDCSRVLVSLVLVLSSFAHLVALTQHMERNRGKTDSRLLHSHVRGARRMDCLSVRRRYVVAADSLPQALPKRFEVSIRDLLCRDRNGGWCVDECRE